MDNYSEISDQKRQLTRDDLDKLALTLMLTVKDDEKAILTLQQALENKDDKKAFEDIFDVLRFKMKGFPEYYSIESIMFIIGEQLGIDIIGQMISKTKRDIDIVQRTKFIRLIENINKYLIEETRKNPYIKFIEYEFPEIPNIGEISQKVADHFTKSGMTVSLSQRTRNLTSLMKDLHPADFNKIDQLILPRSDCLIFYLSEESMSESEGKEEEE